MGSRRFWEISLASKFHRRLFLERLVTAEAGSASNKWDVRGVRRDSGLGKWKVGPRASPEFGSTLSLRSALASTPQLHSTSIVSSNLLTSLHLSNKIPLSSVGPVTHFGPTLF